MFRGSIVAIVTPFKKGQIDEKKLRELVTFQVDNGTNGIVPCGTTGESPTLTHEEHEQVVEICIDAAQGRIPIIAGTGSNSTAEAITLTKHAAKAGADGALLVTPYYNKPTQEGLYRHFKAIADEVAIPIILYNIPGRSSRNIEVPTMARLAKDCKNIIGVKEAAGSVAQMQLIKQLCPKDFLLISGDDALTLPLLSIGGVGVISVVANIIPQDVAALTKTFNDGKIFEAQQIHFKMLPLIDAMFVETNPIPVKTAMGLMGMCSDEMRMPLCPMAPASLEILKKALKAYNLIK